MAIFSSVYASVRDEITYFSTRITVLNKDISEKYSSIQWDNGT